MRVGNQSYNLLLGFDVSTSRTKQGQHRINPFGHSLQNISREALLKGKDQLS
jgi:hypothetical protein